MTYTTASDPAGRERVELVIPDATVPEFVLGRAHLRGGKRALVEAGTGRELSYAQLAAAVQEAGAWLSSRGVRPGDVLALCAPNSIEFAVSWHAASLIGAILTTVNPIATEEEIVHQLRQTAARWLVTTSPLAPGLEAAALASGTAGTLVIGAGPRRHRMHVNLRCSALRAAPAPGPLPSALPMSPSCRPRAARPDCPRAWC